MYIPVSCWMPQLCDPPSQKPAWTTMPGLATYPPFPDDVPTHPLLIIDYQLVKAGSEDEIEKLWKAATELGFWYLKNHGVEEEVEAMFDMGRETLALPLEKKMRYEQGDKGFSFGYKAAGMQFMDNNGTRDVTEFLNISKDDALAWPTPFHRTYPSTVNSHMDSVIKPFAPPAKPEHMGKNFLSAHTDFGSLSFLHNRLGGLQPIPGHAICNIGDALNMFSGGILRSNIHRVIPPPKEQAQHERWSVVFFTRPNDNVELHDLSQESALIAEAVAKAPMGKYRPGVTAKEWLARRVGAQRYTNYKVCLYRNSRRFGNRDVPLLQ
ncbi:hypothetical protein BC628DRAFT_1364208 [Trametes gibbosa]|nr:hypothetical protein BC628DRAFT_1364208 [Trametes gibbosa]